jgi:hypothetical protein
VSVVQQAVNGFYPVHFVDGSFGITVKSGKVLDHQWYWLTETLFNEGEQLEVGNMYENPELLTIPNDVA